MRDTEADAVAFAPRCIAHLVKLVEYVRHGVGGDPDARVDDLQAQVVSLR